MALFSVKNDVRKTTSFAQKFFWTRAVVFLVVFFHACVGTYIYTASQAQAAVPRILNYQLRLTDSAGIPVPDGTKNIIIRFYDAATDGSMLHSDCDTTGTPIARKVIFTNGVGTVLIGDTAASGTTNCADSAAPDAIPTTLFTNTTLYLGVKVESDAEMTPRKRVAASTYALNADRLDDLETSNAGGSNAFVPVTDSSGNFTLTRTVTLGSLGEFVIDTAGNLTTSGDIALNGADLTSTSTSTGTLFNTNITTLNIGGATTTLNFAGGSGSTGCSIDSSGNLACSGTISSGSGTAFVQGGNSFGALATLGTNDTQALAFETDASERMRILSGGNVGIGSTTPTDLLDVYGTSTGSLGLRGRNISAGASAYSTFYLGNATSATDAVFFNVGTGNSAYGGARSGGLGTNASAPFVFITAGSERIRIEADGDVGIGTTIPASLLEARKDQNTGTELRLTNQNTGSLAYGAVVVQSGTTEAEKAYFGINDADYGNLGAGRAYVLNSGVGIALRANGGSSSIIMATGGDAASNERLRIDSAGLVGIGTTGPGSLLEVRRDQNAATELRLTNQSTGSSAYAAFIAQSGTLEAEKAYFGINDADYGNAGANRAYIINSGNGIALRASGGSGDIIMYTGGDAGGNNRLHISSAGNVGINDSTPDARFDVEDTTTSDSFGGIITSSGTGTSGISPAAIGAFNTITSSAGVANGDTKYGLYISSTGIFTPTSGSTNNYGLYVAGATGATNNYAGYFGGNIAGTITTLDSSISTVGLLPSVTTVDIVGGSASTGCSIDGSGNLACAGTISSGGGGGVAFVQNGNSFGALATLGTNDTQALAFETDGTERIRILSGGNVGIGTTSPNTKLDVNGVLKVGVADGTSVSGDFYIRSTNTGAFTDDPGGTLNIQSGRGTGTQGAALRFWTGSTGSSGTTLNALVERLTILPSGNVGIGDITPAALLTVGTSDAFQVDSSGNVTTGGDIALNGADLTTSSTGTATLFNTNATTLNLGGAVGAGGINFAGGFGSTGCTIAGDTGTITCTVGVATSNSLVPSVDDTYDLGSATLRWRDLYLGPASLHIYNQAHATNYDQIKLGYESNVATLRSTAAGTGTVRPLQILTGTGSTPALYVDTSNKVGIGIAGPSYTLDVRSGATAETMSLLSTDTTTYSPSSYQAISRLTFNGGIATGSANLIRFTNGANHEAFFGTVQNSSGYAEFVLKSYGGTYAERMRIDSSGNVGIGTTTLSGRLNTYIGGAANNSYLLSDADQQATIFLGSTSTAIYRPPSTTNLKLYAGGADVVTILSSGYVGIGTTSPNTPLEVNGALQIRAGYGGNATAANDLRLGAGGSSPNAISVSFGDNSGWKYHIGTNVSSTFTPRLTVMDTGSVGIGSTSPGAALDVVGLIRATGGFQNIQSGVTTTLAADGSGTYLEAVGANNLRFYTNSAERIRIDSAGYVGIGDTSPDQMLDVEGGIFAQGDKFQVGAVTMGQATNGQMRLDLARDFSFATSGPSMSWNAYYDGGNFKYSRNDTAFNFYKPGNNLEFYAAPSGTAGNNVTFTKLMEFVPVTATSSLLPSVKIGPASISANYSLILGGNLGQRGRATAVLTGSINPTASTTVTGVGTAFGTELLVGDRITVSGETRTVVAIAGSTSLTVDTAFSDNADDASPDVLYALQAVRESGNSLVYVMNDLGYVGIGTAAPTQKLDVAGNIALTGAIVQGGYLDGTHNNLVYNGDFETGTSAGWKQTSGAAVTSVIAPTASYAGKYVLEITGVVDILTDDYIPVDPDYDVLQLEGYFKKTVDGTTPGIMYFGYIAYDKDKVAITTAPCGTYCYFAAAAYDINVDSAWHKFSATTTGEGTSFPNFPVGTKFVRVLALINYSGSGDTVTQIDHITLKRINHGPLFVGNNFTSTNLLDQQQVTQLYTTSGNNLLILPPSSGNVGIGTTSLAAGAKLDVAGTGSTGLHVTGGASSSPYIQLNQTSTGRAYIQYNNTGFTEYYSQGAHYFSNVNVGIGTSSPSSPAGVERFLQVGSTASLHAGIVFRDNNGAFDNWTDAGNLYWHNGGYRLFLSSTGQLGLGVTSLTGQLGNTTTNVADAAAVGLSTASIGWEINAQGYVAGLSNLDATASNRNGLLVETAATDTASYIAKFESGGSNRLTVRADGSVGIATAGPDELLHVSGSSAGVGAHIGNVYTGVWDGGSGYAAFVHNTHKATSGSYALLQGSAGDTYLNAASGQPIYFRIGNSDRMYLSSAGDVGIGTTNSSSAKLQVESTYTNATGYGINSSLTQSVTDDTSAPFYTIGLSSNITTVVASGENNSGYSMGIDVGNLRSTAGDAGTLGSLIGQRIQVGNYTGTATTRVTGDMYGLQVIPHYASGNGTITNFYGVYIGSGSTGGTVTNNYGVYQDTAAVKNYFAGNTGIGGVPVNAKAHVFGDLRISSSAPLLWLTDTDIANTGFAVSANASLFKVDQISDAGAGGSNLLTIDRASGNVGIGGTPANKLHVIDGTDISPSSTATGQFAIGGSGYTSYIAMNGTGTYFGHNSSGRTLVFQTDETDRLTIGGGGGVVVVAGNTFTANGDVNLGDATADTIVFNGRVGSAIVPTTNDTYALGSDSLRWSDVFIGPSTVHIGTSTAAEGTIAYSGGVLTIGTDTTGAAPIAFAPDATERMRILANGNVGIGTTAPTEKLTIADGNVTTYNDGLVLGNFGAYLHQDFNDGALPSDFAATNITTTFPAPGSFARLTSTSGDPLFHWNALSITGGVHRYVVFKLRYVSGSTSAQGQIYYSTSTAGGCTSHGESESFTKTYTVDTSGNWKTYVLDMWSLTAGGTDWKDCTITSIRNDWANASGVAYDLEWIAIGKDSPSGLANIYEKSGYVGIGTTSPNTALTVSSGAATYLRVGSTGANTLDRGLQFTDSAGSTSGYVISVPNTVGTSSLMYFYVGGGAGGDLKMTINDDGGVGIGDTTPTNKLDVTGAIGISDTTVIDASRNLVNIGTISSGAITSGLINGQTISSAANLTGSLTVAGQITSTTSGGTLQNTSGGTAAQFIRLASTGADTYIGNESSVAGSFFTGSLAYSALTYSSTAFQHIIGGVSRMIIDTSGKVGIATTSPDDLLHIQDPTQAVSNTQLTLEGGYNGYGAGLDFVSRTSSGGTRVSMAKITADGEGTWTTTASTQDANLRFFTTLDGTQGERMRINSAGNVSIGTTGNAARLHVYGGYTDTTLRLQAATGQSSPNDSSFLHLWASEPGMTYTGAGIGNNVYNQTSFPRIDTARGGSYMRLLDNSITLNVVNSSGTDSSGISIGSSGNVTVGGTLASGLINGQTISSAANFTGTVTAASTLTATGVNFASGPSITTDGTTRINLNAASYTYVPTGVFYVEGSSILRGGISDDAGALDLTDDITVSGNTTLGDSSGDTLTINGTAISAPNHLNIDSNTLYVDVSNNRVGIVTATPAQPLDVNGGSIFRDYLQLNSTTTLSGYVGTGNGLITGAATSSAALRSAGALYLSTNNSATASLTIDTSGNVGIGSTSVLDRLQVLGANTPVGLGEFQGPNLVINGGAEDGVAPNPSGWTSRDFGVDGSSGTGVSETSTSFAGANRFYAANDGGMNQQVTVIPGAVYTLSARMRVRTQGGGDASNGYIVWDTSATGHTNEVTCDPNTYDTTPTSNQWVLCSLTFNAPTSTDTATTSIYVGFRAQSSTHSIIVDNVSLVRGGQVGSYSPLATVIGSSNSTLLSGNVGIGTTSSSYPLEVRGKGSDYQLKLSSADGYVIMGPANASYSHFYTDRPTFYFNTSLQVDSGNIGSYSQDLSLKTSGTTRVTILNSNGNVGIGTTGPVHKLNLYGAGGGNAGGGLLGIDLTDDQVFSWASESLNSSLTAGHNVAHFIGKESSTNNAAYFGFNYVGAGSASNFATIGIFAADNLLNIQAGGNVGIGDTSPTNKLDVAGAIGISDTMVIDTSRNLVNIGTITSGLINGQTISSAANFTGTVASGAITSSGAVQATNFRDGIGAYNVNLGSGGSEGRGVVAGYSGGSYSGIGYNIRHSSNSAEYFAPSADTVSYLLFTGGGFAFLSEDGGTAGRNLTGGDALTNRMQLTGAGVLTVNGNTAWHAGNDGAGSGLDADLLDGLNVAGTGTGPIWGSIARINTDGVMEIGKYIDFHNTSSDGVDYPNRLESLAAGTVTLNGSTIWHAGNDGSGSGLDADLLDGLTQTSASTGSTIVSRDSNGDFNGRYINSTHFNSTDDVSTGTITYLMGKFGDNYYRSATAAKVQTFLGLSSADSPTFTGLTLTGTLQRGNIRQYALSRSLSASTVGNYTNIGTFTQTTAGIYAKFKLYGTTNNTVQMVEYEFANTDYPTQTDWVELPMKSGMRFGGVNDFAIDVRQSANNVGVEVRIRLTATNASETLPLTIEVETNTAFTASTSTGTGATVVTGYMAQNSFQFPVSANRWPNSTAGLFITAAGSVGIGSTTPGATLDVQGGHLNVGGTFANAAGYNKSIRVEGSSHSIIRTVGGTVAAGFLTDTTISEPKAKIGTESNNSFGIFTNGATRLTIDTSGNANFTGQILSNVAAGSLGLAETSGVAILRHSGSTITRPLLILQSQTSGSVDGDSFVTFGTQSANWSVGADQADSSKFRIEPATTLGGATGLTITTGGNVGIGTASPSQPLDVNGGSLFREYAQFNSATTLSGYVGQASGLITGGATSSLGIRSANILYLSTANSATAAVTVDGSGNVGIGVAPSMKLDVRSGATGNTAILLSTDATAYSASSYQDINRLTLYGGNATGSNNLIRFAGSGGSHEGYFGTVQNSSGYAEFIWKNYNGSSYGERMRMDSAGNVGIGDNSPASLLTVGSGDLFQVNSSGNLVKINNVTYSWPGSQGGGSTVLTNNGSGTLTWTAAASGTVTGSGTTGNIPKWSSSTALGDSPIYDDGTTVYIGGSRSVNAGVLITDASNSKVKIGGGSGFPSLQITEVASGIRFASQNSTLGSSGGTIDFPDQSSGTCSSGTAQGVLFRDDAGTQGGHMCFDAGTSTLKFYANQFNTSATDVAELYSTDPGENLLPGELVIFDRAAGNLRVKRATGAYAQDIAGIISTAPGIQLTGIDEATGAGDTVKGKPVAMGGRVPVKVSTENGAIAVGDILTSSATVPGAAMKATKPGMTIGRALDAYSGVGTGTIRVFVEVAWNAALAIGTDGSISQFTDDFNFVKNGAATSGEPLKDSKSLSFTTSAWDAAANGGLGAAVSRKLAFAAAPVSATASKLSLRNNTGTEVTYLGDNGDIALSGKLYPSDRGAIQNTKYIYYDGSEGPGGDFMRTNASGWGTGSYDFAEMFPSDEELNAGVLTMIDPAKPGKMKMAIKATDNSAYLLSGIVSTRPGFLAGMNDVGNYPIALKGRVPTKVSTENGEIKVGDPITISSTPGVGMKATTPTYVVGYALDSFNGTGLGTITVYVNLGWYGGNGAPIVSANTETSGATLTTFATDVNLNGHLLLNVRGIIGLTWSISEEGKLVSKELEADKVTTKEIAVEQTDEKQATGEGVLTVGSSIVTIENVLVKPNSRIFVTFFGNTGSSWWISKREAGRFEVTLAAPANADLQFEYLIMDVKDSRTPPQQTNNTPTPTPEPLSEPVPELTPTPEPSPEPSPEPATTPEPAPESE